MTNLAPKLSILKPLQLLQNSLLGLFVAALIVSLAGPTFAAGCHTATHGLSVRGVDPFGNPLPENVVKTYNGGEFAYYILPAGKSCNGPSCRGLPPTNMTSQPAAGTSDRVDISCICNRNPAGETYYVGPLCLWPSSTLRSPVLGDLLRPPTV
jgi:hypothetical protein